MTIAEEKAMRAYPDHEGFVFDDERKAFVKGYEQALKDIWHKESEHPNNRHPYPVLNPDGEMAFAYYDELSGWQFDRDFKHSVNMMWLDIERILPKKED